MRRVRSTQGAPNTTRGRLAACGPTGRASRCPNSNYRSPHLIRRFDVAYDDGEAETRVEERLIRSLDGGGRGSRSPSPRGGGRGRLREGDKIEARYRGRSRFYPGCIARDRGDDTYDIDYDDGEKETRVLAEYIKKTGGGGSPRDDSRSPRGRRGSRLSEGDSIEARYRAHRRGS